jgi:hypothetical protein
MARKDEQGHHIQAKNKAANYCQISPKEDVQCILKLENLRSQKKQKEEEDAYD